MAAVLLSPQTVHEVSWERHTRRHIFHRHYQAEGENISRYMAALRKAIQHCGFRELDYILLDQLVCGQAIDEAQAAELSNQSAAEIPGSGETATGRENQSVHMELKRI
ncbi:hypothetical protein E2320_002072 [Naja naja]|nr:hypothetical protein E2320_002072 [Naja naja]